MANHHHLLVLRFSSLGDVAMTVPVIKLLLQQHPHLQVTMVSNQFVQPLFSDMNRLHFFAADLKGRHRGIRGLYRLYRDLKKNNSFDAIADLHDVLRSKILRSFFLFSGKKISVIDKGRKEKKELTRQKNKILRPLKSTFERYATVFANLNLPVLLNAAQGIKKMVTNSDSEFQLVEQKENQVIGIAPFAQYAEKTYPPEKMKEVMRMLLQHPNIRIFLFGGNNEKEILQQWEAEFVRTHSMVGKMSFEKELQIIAQMKLMISMDSAKMHLAALYGVPVASIWGATHPYAGFYGWGQDAENAVQVELYCRPCSVFGNKPGYRGDLACLHSISPVSVYEKVIKILFAENT